MEKFDIKDEELLEKIKQGLDLTFKKLVKEKRKNDGVFVFCENGIIKEVKAKDIKIDDSDL